MKIDYGLELLKVTRKQRQSYVQLLDGKKLITNLLSYRQCEDEIERLSILLGRENKRAIKKECDERGIPYPKTECGEVVRWGFKVE